MAGWLSNRGVQALLAVVGLMLTGLLVGSNIIVKYLWMDALTFASVYSTILQLKVGLFVGMFVVATAYFGINVAWVIRTMPPLWASQWAQQGEAPRVGGKPLTKARLRRVGYLMSGGLGLLFALGFSSQWDALVRYWQATPYGQTDPLYGLDLSFYLLELPFIQILQSAWVGLAVLALMAVVTAYLLTGTIGIEEGQFKLRPAVVRHVGWNVMLLLVGWAWGYYLDRYELLLNASGTVYGASYTDVYVTLPALWMMVAATVVLIGVVGYSVYQTAWLTLGWGIGGYVVLLAAGLVAAPALVQQVYVVPNELNVERPYIEYNIANTREAYRLNTIEERSYAARTNLTRQDIETNQSTLRNIRLWDPRLLIDTYIQLQQIRPYYRFYNVDVDRYMVNGDYRQVMLAARELTQTLPGNANTWFNRHLQFTHGYGAVANLVAREGTEGSPEFLVKDLPPVTTDSSFAVKEPAIYYGEAVPTYRIVSTSAQELAYPKGDDNVYISYKGTGGVSLASGWRQLLFAYELGDYNILLSDYLTSDSRIQFWNRITERVQKIAPFLRLDSDPYFVMGDDRQYWIIDAYTTSQSFPYAEPVQSGRFRGTKYIRNAVKIVVDAYNGDVSFYVNRPNDPILKAYQAAFPSLFEPIDAMPPTLRDHVRYPEDLFTIQVEKYNRYHMMSPQVFYNNEDLWERPMEQYAGQQQVIEPYYVLTRLPDEKRLQFLLMTPLTPANRDNMIAWVAAKSDPPNYGELVAYKLPKEKLIYGPNQVESRIDQNTDISRQLSLWDQRGSRVVRGNLIVVPIEESFLYVEPIFLIAQNISIPQLRRVIVSYGEEVAMEPTLEQALNAVFEGQLLPTPGVESDGPQQGDATQATPVRRVDRSAAELQRARQLLQEAREALQQGDFSTFGERLRALEQALAPDTTGGS
nr:UPF0182 family protein [Salisaeta longa]